MKRLILSVCSLLLSLSILIWLPSCTYTVTVDGIENFSREDSESSLTRFLIPDNFLDMFSYIEGDYAYYDDLSYSGAYETAILYMNYDKEVYDAAKEYALDNLEFMEDVEEFYNEFVFHQRLISSDSHKNKRCFFAYSDEQRILLAVGTHITLEEGYNYSSVEDFFDTYFPFYNFETGKIERKQNESTAKTTAALS